MSSHITYQQLQKDHPGKLVALNAEETEIIASAKTFPPLLKKISDKNCDPSECIIVGPLPESDRPKA